MGTEWRIIQRRGQLRIYQKEEKDFELKFKLSLLNLILLLQDVGKACETMSISPTTAYRWINFWNEDGKDGLKSEQGKGGGKPPKMGKGDCRKSAKIETSKNIIITKPLRIGVSNLDCYIITPRKEGFPTISKEQFKELERILREEKEWWTTKEVRILIKEKI